MPFGTKAYRSTEVDFDSVFREGIKPGVELAGARAVRADQLGSNGTYADAVFLQLLQAEIVVVDCTTSNPSVYYELGIRHAARSNVTILLSADDYPPVNVGPSSWVRYKLQSGCLTSPIDFRRDLCLAIESGLLRPERTDSPVFGLVNEYAGIQYTATKDSPRVFLSYAREDENQVGKIYSKLAKAGFQPWMDMQDIVGGEDWKRAIELAQDESDFTILCISRYSKRKRGYFQREVRRALDRSTDFFDSDIFVIPIRLDDSPIPESLSQFQWIDMFAEHGWSRLVTTLQEGADRRSK